MLFRLFSVLFLLFSFISTPLAFGEESEAEVKAALLYNFAKYIEWPESHQAVRPIVFAVLGSEAVAESLFRISAGRTVGGREVRVIELRPDGTERFDVLFIGGDHEVGTLPSRVGVLVVGESPRFLERGGMITFVRREGKIRFDINVEAAMRAELRISSALISLADRVVRR